MDPEEVRELFHRSGALLEGHFRLSSGLHSARYLQCALVLQDPRRAERLGAAIADRVRDSSLDPTVVLSPAMGGIIIGHEVARALDVRANFAERENGTLTLRRGFSIGPADRVLVVEDVLTTGGSTRETIDLARSAGSVVVAAAAIVDRSGGASGLDVPFLSLLQLSVPSHRPADCPLCAGGAPIVKPGSRT